VDSASATAHELLQLLERASLRRRDTGETAPLELLVTDLPASFQSVARRFLGRGPLEAQQIDLG
jgi:glutamate racemase